MSGLSAYLEVADQIGGAGQSACCLCFRNGCVSHMAHTGEGDFCCSDPGNLGGDTPKEKEIERKRRRRNRMSGQQKEQYTQRGRTDVYENSMSERLIRKVNGTKQQTRITHKHLALTIVSATIERPVRLSALTMAFLSSGDSHHLSSQR